MRLLYLVGLFALVGAVMGPSPVLAVHDFGVFQLDGDATTNATLPPASDDWDRVCHEVTGSDCSTSSNTTGATAVSWTSEPDRSASIFTGGGSKDPQDINNWAWKDAGGLPDKDNLLHSFAARYTVTGGVGDCPVSTTCDALYFGSDRNDNSGDAQQGFWFLQNPCNLNGAKSGGGTGFACTDPTPGTNPADDFHRVGDLLILSDFSNGGSISTINIYKWNGSGLTFLAGGDNEKCSPALTNDDFCGIVNPGTITMPWSFTDKSGTPGNGALNGEFFEGGVNLSSPEINLSGECFATLVSETRSSTSTTATLKDFVLGQFAQCSATLETTPSATSVNPGDPVHDTATVIGNQPTKTPSGTVTFFLCSFPTGSTSTCDAGGDSIGTGTLSGSGGTATADSPNVNCASDGAGCATGKNPLAPGHYCFRAEWPGDSNYIGKLTFDSASECFDVAQIPTNTVSSPQPSTSVSFNALVTDHAVVTATSSADGTPTGTVTFFVCNPSQTSGGACPSPNGTQVGSPVTATAVSGSNPPASEATSDAVTANALGTWCFRAVYTPGGTNGDKYIGSSDATSGECFTVTDTTSITTVQRWLPNDSGTITSGGSTLNGTAVFTLYDSSDCTGTVLYTSGNIPVSGGTSAAVSTNNTTVYITVAANRTVSWQLVYTSNVAGASGSTSSCETTNMTIAN